MTAPAPDALRTALDAYSAKATAGRWYHYDEVFRAQFGQRRVTEIQQEKSGRTIIKWIGFDGADPGPHKKRNHNARFVVALVNAYRSGQLVVRDGAERASHAECDALKGEIARKDAALWEAEAYIEIVPPHRTSDTAYALAAVTAIRAALAPEAQSHE